MYGGVGGAYGDAMMEEGTHRLLYRVVKKDL